MPQNDPRTWRVITPPDWNGWALIEVEPSKTYYTEETDPLNPSGPKLKVQRQRHGKVLRTDSGGPITFREVEAGQAYIQAAIDGIPAPALVADDLPPSSKFTHTDPPMPKKERTARKPKQA